MSQTIEAKPGRYNGWGHWLAVASIRLYQNTLSRMLPPACRFYPTCSEYAAQAIDRHGVKQGIWLALKRLLRCHPFQPGGYDPVP